MLMHILAQLVAFALGVFGGPSGAYDLPVGAGILRASGGSARVSTPRAEPVVQPTVAPDGGGLIMRYHGLDCDGVDDYATISPSFTLDTARPWTVMLWTRIEAFPPSFQGLVELSTDRTTGFIIAVSNQVGPYLGVLIGSNANFVQLKDDSPELYWPAAWRHVTVIYDGNGRTATESYALYLDGTSRTLLPAGPYSTVLNASHLGRCQANYLNGIVAQVRVWQTALTEADVRAEMRSTSPVRSGAILACALRPESGQAIPLAQTVRDESGNGHVVTRGANESIGNDDPAWVPATGWTAIGANGPF